MSTLKIASFNVNGINEDTKCYAVFNTLQNLNCDIIAIQETHITKEKIETLKKKWPYESIWNPAPKSDSRGVAILFGPKIELKGTKLDKDGRVLTTKIKHDNTTVQVTNIYATNENKDREDFFKNVTDYMYKNTRHTILTGDFNMVEEPEIDRNPSVKPSNGYYTTYNKGKNNLNRLKEEYNLTDKWRESYPKRREFTWNSQRKTNDKKASRLDRFYISDEMTLIYQQNLKTAYSDHNILTAKIAIQTNAQRGPGYYKLNTSVLEDPEYITYMTDILTRVMYDETDPNGWLEKIKLYAKNYTIQYCKQKRRRIRTQIENLQEKLNETIDQTEVDKISKDIIYLNNEIDKGIIIRSREQTVLNEDKPNKYFYLQEQIIQKKSIIKEIHTIDENDEITNIYDNEDSVMKELHRHHQELYTDKEIDENAQQYFLDAIDKRLTQEEKDYLDSPVTFEELLEAILTTKTNKTPGPSGLPIEFWDAFKLSLGPNLVKVFNHIRTSKTQPISQKIGYIKLIHKKGIKELLSNWRAITLLETDHKLMTKIMATRLRKVLPSIISEDQTCSIKGREIFDNTFLLRDTIDHATAKNVPTYIISYDVKNAFDSINHNYLYKVLEKFNFGEIFINYIKTIYTDRRVYIMNNGHFSLPVSVQRGLSQGDSLSQPLYITGEEPKAMAIRKHQQIKGYRLPACPRPCKLSMYADDTDQLTTDATSVQTTVDILDKFEKASGCGLNHSKTNGLMLNTNEIPNVRIPIRWNTEGGFEALGIIWYVNKLTTINTNWRKIIKKIDKRLKQLRYRKLSFQGRIYILNVLVLAKAVYLSTVLKMPKWAWDGLDARERQLRQGIQEDECIIKGIKKLIFEYVFEGEDHRSIKEEIFFLPKEQGGLGLINLLEHNKALRLKHIFKITDQTYKMPWVYIARYWNSYQLHRYKPDWAFLMANRNNTPRYIPSGHNARPQTYNDLLDDFNQHHEAIIENKATTTKSIYSVIRITENEKATPFVQHTWERVRVLTLSPIRWGKVWRNMYISYNVGRMRDILYKIVHNRIGTRVNVKKTRQRQGIPYSTICKVCNRYEENTLHLFARCKHATNIWKTYKNIYTKLIPNKPYIYEQTALTINIQSIEHKKTRKLVTTLTEIILKEIWTTRNKVDKENIEPSKDRSKNRINKELTDLITIHYTHNKRTNTFQNFTEKFAINEALCSLDYHNRLNLHLPP